MKAFGEVRTRKDASLILIFLVAASGCGATGRALTRQSLNMETNRERKDAFAIGNTTIPVEVFQSSKKGLITESIRDVGEEIEQEQYKIGDSTLDLIKASDDSFDPPLPLLEFPARTGQSYNWSGQILEAGMSRSASASISVTSDQLKFPGQTEDSLRVTVNLSISSEPTPASRKFEFWFVPGGLAKRVFGLGTSRTEADLTP